MQIGQVIRKYRTDKNMTQEELAERLGVTAPAVNKWEKGNSCPDIMLLAPIARLLGVSLDTLLSFQAELTEEQVNGLLLELERKLESEGMKEAVSWFVKKTEAYPNCERLLLYGTINLDAYRIAFPLKEQEEEKEACNALIISNYKRALESEDCTIRDVAADSLFGWYLRTEEYEKAEECLACFSSNYPDQERKRAVVCRHTGRREEAYRILETILYQKYTEISSLFHELYGMAVEEEDMVRARSMVEKQRGLAGIFEMGKYAEVSAGLELAVYEKDAEKAIGIAEKMLENIEDLYCFTESDLYRHMEFKEPRGLFFEKLKDNLWRNFREGQEFHFLRNDERWRNLVGER